MGNILKMFARDEYQKEVGNVPHVHVLLCISTNGPAYLDRKVHEIIRGSLEDIIWEDEVDQFISEDLLDSWDDYRECRRLMKIILSHTCTQRCIVRTGPGEHDFRCRANDNARLSPDITKHNLVDINVRHSEQALNLLQEIGLCTITDDNYEEPKIHCDELKAL